MGMPKCPKCCSEAVELDLKFDDTAFAQVFSISNYDCLKCGTYFTVDHTH